MLLFVIQQFSTRDFDVGNLFNRGVCFVGAKFSTRNLMCENFDVLCCCAIVNKDYVVSMYFMHFLYKFSAWNSAVRQFQAGILVLAKFSTRNFVESLLARDARSTAYILPSTFIGPLISLGFVFLRNTSLFCLFERISSGIGCGYVFLRLH